MAVDRGGHDNPLILDLIEKVNLLQHTANLNLQAEGRAAEDRKEAAESRKGIYVKLENMAIENVTTKLQIGNIQSNQADIKLKVETIEKQVHGYTNQIIGVGWVMKVIYMIVGVILGVLGYKIGIPK